MSNNLKKNNLKPFINKIVIDSSGNDFLLRNIIVKNDNKEKLLPFIPPYYFQNNPEDNIGSKIINTYYNIDFNLKKLNIIKNFIISILESSKYDLEKIKFSREKYRLFKENLFFKFSDDISESFKDQNDFKEKFIDVYVKNKYDLLNKNKIENFPFFIKIFQNEYQNNSESKTYFMNLFKKYLEIRKILIKYIQTDYGLLAFKFLFDLSNTQFFGKLKEIEKKKLKKEQNKNNKTILYNNYMLYGKNLGFNSNNQFKVGDNLKTKDSSISVSLPTEINLNLNKIQKIVIYRIDFRNSPDEPYTLQITTNDKPPKVYYKNISIQDMEKKYEKAEAKISKNLVNQIHFFNLLYVNVANQEYFKNEYMRNIGIYYSDLNKSLNKYFGDDFSNNLYNLLTSGFESDFNIIQFTFNYTDPLLFTKMVDLQYLIKNSISNKINLFEQNYEAYIEWYEIFAGISSKLNFDLGATTDSDFKLFFDKLFKESTGQNAL